MSDPTITMTVQSTAGFSIGDVVEIAPPYRSRWKRVIDWFALRDVPKPFKFTITDLDAKTFSLVYGVALATPRIPSDETL